MAAQVRVQYRDDSVRKYLRGMPKAVHNATRRGLNKGITQVRTAASKGIRAERKLPAKEVNAALKIDRANYKKLSAKVKASGRAISLKHYGARVVAGRGRRRRGAKPRNHPVQVQVRPGAKKIVRGAFLGPGGHVFKRKGRARLPIEKLFGPSIPRTFIQDRVNGAMVHVANRKVPDIIEHELRRELKRV